MMMMRSRRRKKRRKKRRRKRRRRKDYKNLTKKSSHGKSGYLFDERHYRSCAPHFLLFFAQELDVLVELQTRPTQKTSPPR